jgi:hypothetical protein
MVDLAIENQMILERFTQWWSLANSGAIINFYDDVVVK